MNHYRSFYHSLPRACIVLIAGILPLHAEIAAQSNHPLMLWYDQPAASHVEKSNWGSWKTYINDALPIGGGSLGALITGEVPRELLRLNDPSLWSGSVKATSGDAPDGYGNFLALADLTITIGSSNAPTEYRRDLDLATARSSVIYTQGGVTYHREYAASHPVGVIAARFSADRPAACSGSIRLWDGTQAAPVSSNLTTTNSGVTTPLSDIRHGEVSASEHELLLRGKVHNGMQYEVQVAVKPTGGKVTVHDGVLEFNGCDSLDLFIAGGTDYAPDSNKGFRGLDPHAAISDRIASALKVGYEKILADQEADYRGIFDRVKLDLGTSTAEQRTMPTDKRRMAAAKMTDPELEALLFQYGRYLMISCSRPGGLPANLQGLWNDSDTPAWHSDYHANINIQMNYWPVEVANMAECHLPLFDLVLSQIPCWREVTIKDQGVGTPDGKLSTRGWAVKTGHNIQGGMTFLWDKTANAWYALHFWEHYAFGKDQEYLRKTAYPMMKEVCEFWQDHLKTLPDGRLVVPNGWSPEHGPTEDGVNYSQEIVWDLFNNTVEAADVLGTDKEFRDQIAAMRDKLVVPRIGSWGQLLEWMNEKGAPTFDAKNEFKKPQEKLIQRLQCADMKKEPVAAIVWKSFPEDLRAKILANPNDSASLIIGLNSLVNGPSLADQEAFRGFCDSTWMAHLCNESVKNPVMRAWLNRSLLVEGLKLEYEVNADDTPLSHHRHTSHLFALYPGRQISVLKTPELARAAEVSLMSRGDAGDVKEWSFAWRCALYARLHQGDAAEGQIKRFFGTTCLNLFGFHGPMQMDGNFGITAAIAEMLLQSHEGNILLLPSLPSVWPTGSVKSLRARGGFEVAMTWDRGNLLKATISSEKGGSTDVAYKDAVQRITLKPGESITLEGPSFSKKS